MNFKIVSQRPFAREWHGFCIKCTPIITDTHIHTKPQITTKRHSNAHTHKYQYTHTHTHTHTPVYPQKTVGRPARAHHCCYRRPALKRCAASVLHWESYPSLQPDDLGGKLLIWEFVDIFGGIIFIWKNNFTIWVESDLGTYLYLMFWGAACLK